MPPPLQIHLPAWLDAETGHDSVTFATVEERMQYAIKLARLNVENGTGGPFGAAIFERLSGHLVAAGVNCVVGQNCSIAHAEMMAIATAQQKIGHYDLGAGDKDHELVTSVEPCAMCLGAVPWSGVSSIVCGARAEDAESIGFKEGAKPQDWIGELSTHGIKTQRDVCRDAAGRVLTQYLESGGMLYNGTRDAGPL
jgi:tRNA(Arg) A34 adenosine deaminase TadA